MEYSSFRGWADQVDENGYVLVTDAVILEAPEGYEWVIGRPTDVILRPMSKELADVNE